MNILLADAVRRKDHGQDLNIFSVGLPRSSIGNPLPSSWGRPVPGEEATTPDLVYAASLRLVEAGLSIIPIDAFDGSKSPDTLRLPHPHDPVDGKSRPSWSAYQIHRPSPDDLLRWFELGSPYGLAIIGGAVSGGKCGFGLEIIDFDQADLAEPWKKIVDQKAPGLVDRLVRVRTPRPGLHCYYRCSRFGGSQKLALGVAKDDFGQTAMDPLGHPIRTTLIEVKAEGGYCLIPPSPARCHPTNHLYRYVDGSADLTCVPTITAEERRILLDAARSLSEYQEPKQVVKPGRSKSSNKSQMLDMPGDDFNARGNWSDILSPHGWVLVGACGDEERWCRPGKTGAVSATVNYQGNGMLHVFTSNASPLEADGSYTKFAAYATLNHGGDFKKAARDLAKQGYGKQARKKNTLVPAQRGIALPGMNTETNIITRSRS